MRGCGKKLISSPTSGKLTMDQKSIEIAIHTVLEKETDFTPEVIHDITFHMTDWLKDLENYNQFCNDPDQMSSEDVHSLLIDFLVHVPNHIVAASKLLTGIPVADVFDVGATKESD